MFILHTEQHANHFPSAGDFN